MYMRVHGDNPFKILRVLQTDTALMRHRYRQPGKISIKDLQDFPQSLSSAVR